VDVIRTNLMRYQVLKCEIGYRSSCILSRIPTSIICSTKLDTAPVVPMGFRVSCTCKRLVDAKVMNTSLVIYLCFLFLQIFLIKLQQDQAISDFCFVARVWWQDIDDCSIGEPHSHNCINKVVAPLSHLCFSGNYGQTVLMVGYSGSQ
jgi:hypothetical protein